MTEVDEREVCPICQGYKLLFVAVTECRKVCEDCRIQVEDVFRDGYHNTWDPTGKFRTTKRTTKRGYDAVFKAYPQLRRDYDAIQEETSSD